MTAHAPAAVQTVVGRTGVETPRLHYIAREPAGAEFEFCEGDAQHVTHRVEVHDSELAAVLAGLPGFTAVRITGTVGAPTGVGHPAIVAERVELVEVDA